MRTERIEERSLEYLGDGAVIGEMTWLDSRPRSATVMALTGCRLLELDQELFSDMVRIDPLVA